MILLPTVAAIILYASAAAWQLRVLAREDGGSARAPSVLALAGAALHAIAMLAIWRTIGGIDLHFFAALALVALGTAALTAALALARPLGALGVLVYPLAAILLAVYGFTDASTPARTAIGWQIQTHAGLSLLAYAALSLAALLAIMLWLQERALRRHRLRPWLEVFPPLTLLESLMFRLVLAGFILLTLSLLTGALFVQDLFAQHLVHKTTLSLLAWVVFGGLLLGRWRQGWRGRRAVRWSLSAMALLGLAFFGSKFVLELVLVRGG